MNLENAAIELADIVKDGVIFIKTSQPIINFTKLFNGTLQIHGFKKTLFIDLNDENELATISYLLNESIRDNLIVITWNIKELFSYFKYNLKNKANFKITCKMYDLMLMELFSGLNNSSPDSLKESLKRLEILSDNKKLKLIHNKIHIPLATTVIPSMETHGVLNIEIKKHVYPTYQIEGQINGRLLCNKPFENSVNPHHLTQEEKSKLKLHSSNDSFVSFDFNCMEIVILQYLSKDKKLGELIEKGGDCYSNVWEAIFNKPCDNIKQRKFIKNSLLKVAYGMQAETLSKEFECNMDFANSFISNIRKLFPEAFDYIDSYQKELKNNDRVEDFIGRSRIFEDRHWRVRNFVVQSPAAIICLEKLIDLYNIIGNKLIFNIHDAYILKANLKYDKHLIIKCKKTLESPSQFMPGLKLKTNCEIGFSLDTLKAV